MNLPASAVRGLAFAGLLTPLWAVGCGHEGPRPAESGPPSRAEGPRLTEPGHSSWDEGPRPAEPGQPSGVERPRSTEPGNPLRAEGQPPVYAEMAPAKPYRELGLVQASGTGDKASKAAMLGSLRERGKSLGCDALTEVNVDVGAKQAHAVGVCVQWVGEGEKGAAREP